MPQAAGAGRMAAPAENVQSFLEGKGRLNIGRVEPTYDRGVVAADLGALLPGELADTLRAGLRAYERKIAGYTAPEAILTGLETRTSSPVRLKREETLESAQLAGVVPLRRGGRICGRHYERRRGRPAGRPCDHRPVCTGRRVRNIDEPS